MRRAAALLVSVCGALAACDARDEVARIATCVGLVEKLHPHAPDLPLDAWRDRLAAARAAAPDLSDGYVRSHMGVGYEASFIILQNATVAAHPTLFDRFYARRIAARCDAGQAARRLMR
ncbi:hypothetical protein [Pseudaestuariivita atlantica]|uniref:Lipoprotein n=1 Tax=Pseudaestuariivita atlantica TaxID=1317121 RepID=A0A0L1JUJ8_9RHOB|nr:hypothetical protein [Pseudaestuariivita atlantica]KNG95088.1 hypothetical protein ATO11_00045 [Pseudaestuariivita atlantica]